MHGFEFQQDQILHNKVCSKLSNFLAAKPHGNRSLSNYFDFSFPETNIHGFFVD